MARRYYDYTVGELRLSGLYPPDMPPYEALESGGLVGWTRIVDCVTTRPSPWKMENPFGVPIYGFVLRDSRPTPFVPLKRRLSIFNVPKEVLHAKQPQ